MNDIYIFTDIDDKLAEDVVREINLLKDSDGITIHINSSGGYMACVMAIVKAMRSAQCPVHTKVYAYAESGASYIAAAGNKGCRHIMKGGYFMFHGPCISIEFHDQPVTLAYDPRSVRIKLDYFKRMMVEKTFLTPSEIEEMITSEKHVLFTAEEAKKVGIVDEVVEW
jgi:ATP-dependent Clp protease protease subunit